MTTILQSVVLDFSELQDAGIKYRPHYAEIEAEIEEKLSQHEWWGLVDVGAVLCNWEREGDIIKITLA